MGILRELLSAKNQGNSLQLKYGYKKEVGFADTERCIYAFIHVHFYFPIPNARKDRIILA